MIILDSLSVSKADGSESGPSTARPYGLDIPPPYLSHNQPTDSDSDSETITHPDKVKKRKRKRRWRWILILFGLVLYTVGITTLLVLKPWKKRTTLDTTYLRFKFWDEPPIPLTYTPVSSVIQDGTALLCNPWDDSHTPSLSRLQYHFPSNLTDMFVNSYDSPLTTGSLYVWAGLDAESIVVDVEVHGQVPSDEEHLDICMMHGPAPGNYGLGIYNMWVNDSDANPRLDIVINVMIPRNISLASLCTHLPRFSQSFGIQSLEDLQDMPNQTYPLRIDALSLSGPVSRLAMRMDEVRRFELDIDAPLRGNLCVSEYLSVTSRSSDISANITLVDRGYPMTVNLEADHAPIDTIVRIANLGTHGPNSTIPFPVHMIIQTSYAPLGIIVDYPDSSPPVALFVEAETELSPVIMQLPPAFQGTFNLTAVQSDARIDQSTVRDPSGKERTRSIYTVDSTLGDEVCGSVSWNYLNTAVFHRLGNVDVSTTLAQGLLQLDDQWSELLSKDVWPTGFRIG